MDQFSETMLADPARLALCEKVKVVHDPDITARGSQFRHLVRVEVFLKDGTVLEESVEAPHGNEKRFATGGEVVEKFEKLACHTLPARQVASIRDVVLHLETLPNAVTLTHLLTNQGGCQWQLRR